MLISFPSLLALPLQHQVTCILIFLFIFLAFLKCFGAGKTQDLIIFCERIPAFKSKLQHSKMYAVWPLRSFSGINRVCGHHFWLKSPNTEPLQWLVVIPTPAAVRDWEVFMWLPLLASYGVHSPLACSRRSSSPGFVQMSHLKWLRHISRDCKKSCNGTFQFYF